MTIVVGMTALTPSVDAHPTTVLVCRGEFVTTEGDDCVKWRAWDDLLGWPATSLCHSFPQSGFGFSCDSSVNNSSAQNLWRISTVFSCALLRVDIDDMLGTIAGK